MKLGLDPAGKPVLLQYGNFGQTVLEFLIVAFVIFMMVKAINSLEAPAAAGPGWRAAAEPGRSAADRDPRPAREALIHRRGEGVPRQVLAA